VAFPAIRDNSGASTPILAVWNWMVTMAITMMPVSVDFTGTTRVGSGARIRIADIGLTLQALKAIRTVAAIAISL